MRLLIEPAIARLAARNGRRDPLAEDYLARMAAVKDINDPAQQAVWSECDRLFHRQLAAMAGNALIAKISGCRVAIDLFQSAPAVEGGRWFTALMLSMRS